MNQDVIDELVEYFDEEIESGDSYDRMLPSKILKSLRDGTPNEAKILEYLGHRMDINDEGGPNREMRLTNSINFERDMAYWRPLYEGEKAAGLLDREDE